jgi:hypothetical protein
VTVFLQLTNSVALLMQHFRRDRDVNINSAFLYSKMEKSFGYRINGSE